MSELDGRPTTMLGRIKHAGWQLLRRAGAKLGFDLVWRDYYSAIPRLDQLPPGFWERKAELRGLELDTAAGLDFVERELSDYISEFNPPRRGNEDTGIFYLDNPVFGTVDAETLYAIVRYAKPAHLVELGSGFSSRVIEEACARNADEGRAVDYRIFDPFPWIDSPGPNAGAINRIPATEVDPAEFERLGAGDVLFVDTTHTVKAGGDVNHIVLDVLPLLSPGVYVHFHDIFLPWEYPREWFEEMQWYWAEQYLLRAFLTFNPEFEVMFAAHATARAAPDRLGALVPSFTGAERPASFWMRRR